MAIQIKKLPQKYFTAQNLRRHKNYNLSIIFFADFT
jgi:hypothetical protein